MAPNRLGLLFMLIAMSSCIAITTANLLRPIVTAQYLNTAIAIARDTYFTNDTEMSLQYVNNLAGLNWEATLGTELGTDVDIQIIILKKVGNCYLRRLNTGRISFCTNVPQNVRTYVNAFLGFSAADPPVESCPFAIGTYSVTDFHIDVSSIANDKIFDSNHEYSLSFEFTVNGAMVIRYVIDVFVN